MPDLYTHVLAGLAVAVVLSWRFAWITPPMVVAAMVGAALPDLNRVDLVLPGATVEAVTGLAWSWSVLHRAGGTLLLVLLLAMLVPRRHRVAVLAMLVVGAASHYALDLLLWTPSGLSGPLLWPLTDWRPPAGGLYRSSDRWPAAVATVVAVGVLAVDRRRS